jgi:hypothetical protein
LRSNHPPGLAPTAEQVAMRQVADRVRRPLLGDVPVLADGQPIPYLQSTLYTKVVLALLTGRGAEPVLDTQRAEHLRAMRELTQRKERGDLADKLICDHALFHLEADLRWLELAASRVDELAATVGGTA